MRALPLLLVPLACAHPLASRSTLETGPEEHEEYEAGSGGGVGLAVYDMMSEMALQRLTAANVYPVFFGERVTGVAIAPSSVTSSGVITGLRFVATAAAAANGLVLESGAFACLSGAACGAKISYDGAFIVLNTATAVSGVLQATGHIRPLAALVNPTTSAECSSNTGAVCVNDAGGLAIANGSGTTVATVSAAGAAAVASVAIGGGTAVTSVLCSSATLDFASAAAGACSADLTITVTGATAGYPAFLGPINASVPAGSQFSQWISGTDTVTVRHCCINGTCDPASGAFTTCAVKF